MVILLPFLVCGGFLYYTDKCRVCGMTSDFFIYFYKCLHFNSMVQSFRFLINFYLISLFIRVGDFFTFFGVFYSFYFFILRDLGEVCFEYTNEKGRFERSFLVRKFVLLCINSFIVFCFYLF